MKLKVIGTATALALICSSILYAHSGRTDSSGGHYNKKTGTYHYHSGSKVSKKTTSKPQKKQKSPIKKTGKRSRK